MTKTEAREAIEYADRRSAVTGYAYLVSSVGNVLLDCDHNKALVLAECGGIYYRSKGKRLQEVRHAL